MCGRFTLTSPPAVIRELFRYDEQPNFPPRYNLAPTQPVAVVLIAEGKRRFALMRWGLLPSWVKDPKGFTLLINARGETAVEKPAFRAAMRHRRCLIPADGFYEWKRDGERNQPYFIHARSGAPFAFAGLWETWIGPNGEELDTVAIVTTQANATLSAIHHRMPVIVPQAAFDIWLGGPNIDAREAATLIAPAPDDLLAAHPVSAKVNRTANDGAQLVEPGTVEVEAPRVAKRRVQADDRQASLF